MLLRRKPALTVWEVGNLGTLPKRSPDLAILEWCEQYGFILVTNNRRSMLEHLIEHHNRGQHIPGILVLRPKASF